MWTLTCICGFMNAHQIKQFHKSGSECYRILKAPISYRIVDKQRLWLVVYNMDTNGKESTLLGPSNPFGPTITKLKSCQPKFWEDQSVLYLMKRFIFLLSCTSQSKIDKCHLGSDKAWFATWVERVDEAGIGGRSILPFLRCRRRCWGFNIQVRLVDSRCLHQSHV